MRSNSLDVKLKKTEKELKAQEQEIADQQELHQLTVKELELTKTAHTITLDECKQLKNKVQWGGEEGGGRGRREGRGGGG